MAVKTWTLFDQTTGEHVGDDFQISGRDVAGGTSDFQAHLHEIALSRPPSANELDMNLTFLANQKRYHEGRNDAAPELAALVDLCDVVLNLSEFIYIN